MSTTVTATMLVWTGLICGYTQDPAIIIGCVTGAAISLARLEYQAMQRNINFHIFHERIGIKMNLYEN